MPKIGVHATVRETMSEPAAAKTGRQRAASHNNIGNSIAPGTTVSQSCCGSKKITVAVIAASAASATVPSVSSLRGGGSCRAAMNPITSGATMTTPTATDANQCGQTVKIGADGPSSNLDATAAPNDDIIHATTVAIIRPKTLRN